MRGLAFELNVPLASWANSGAQYRPTDVIPSWSALCGMVGAAMGWQRGDDKLVQFAQEFAPAISLKNFGGRFVDFHTIQTPDKKLFSYRPPRTREQEITKAVAKGKLNTSITNREYLEDVRYEVLIVQLGEGLEISDLCAALRSPRFPLYAGRRSCPIGFIDAQLVEGEPLEMLPGVTHWDTRLDFGIEPSIIRERRDLLLRAVEPRRFGIRQEALV